MESKVASNLDRPRLHPAPPADLSQRSLPLLTTSQTWFRIYSTRYEPLTFRKSSDRRFDLPHGESGVVYVAADEHGAFIETLGHTTGNRAVTVSALHSRSLAEIQVRSPLKLVDLTGAGLVQIGADERLCAGEYRIAQRWSLALFRHPEKPDGLYYRSRHDPDRLCAALYRRAARKLKVARRLSLGDQEAVWLLDTILRTYAFSLIDDGG